MKSYKIAYIPGDGVGLEVGEATLLVLEKLSKATGFELEINHFDWSCDTYLATGRMMPEDGIEQLRPHDAILLGAVGWPAKVPDDVSLHGLLLPIRKAFDLYANVRPHRVLPGVISPIRSDKFDLLCIRENTEGEYSGAGGRIHRGTPLETAVETAIFTRTGIERILRYGFQQARRRRKRLASVSKSNAQRHSMVFWDEVMAEVAKDYPDVEARQYHVDAIAARMVTAPETLDVIVASNLFGDILTDLGAAIQGGLGFAASANINPDRDVPSMFEPVHGSAPDIAGEGKANPIAMLWSASQMLDHLGEVDAAATLMKAIEAVTAAQQTSTPDMGGMAKTMDVARAIAGRL